MLNRQYSWFEGTIDWLGIQCSVSLETDEEDGETAVKAYAHLQELHKNMKERDEKFRRFATGELWELANDWYEDDDEDDGEDMFTDHAIEIDADINGELKSANIVG